jgi:hypothetical protein
VEIIQILLIKFIFVCDSTAIDGLPSERRRVDPRRLEIQVQPIVHDLVIVLMLLRVSKILKPPKNKTYGLELLTFGTARLLILTLLT